MKRKNIGCITAVIALLLIVSLMFQYESISCVKPYLSNLRSKVDTSPREIVMTESEDYSRSMQTLSINRSAAWAPTGINHEDKSSPNQTYYDEIRCDTKDSKDTCTFPLLTEYHKRCGYFAMTSSWKYLDADYPNAAMTAHMCKVTYRLEFIQIKHKKWITIE